MLVMAILLALWSAAAQPPGGPATVIRTESRLVLVDAVVTDRGGNYVTDLTAKDFHVWDDNKEQTVQSVTFRADRAAQPDARSYLVLFFDNTTLDSNAQTRAREEAAAFIDATAGPKHLMAIVNYGAGLEITQNFTADAERLKRVASDAKTAAARTRRAPDQVVMVRRGGVNTLSTADPLGDHSSSSILLALRALAANLSTVPGRKSVVIFTSDIPMTPQVRAPLTAAVNMCNRSNIAVYAMDVAGLSLNQVAGPRNAPSGDPNAATAEKLAQLGAVTPESAAPDRQILDALANGTGGSVFSGSNDLRRALITVANEQNQYYLVSYVPSETPEGSCHALRVKVDRGGATVRARASYCNVRAVDLLAGKPIERNLEDLIAGDQPGRMAASMLVPFFYAEADTARLRVAMEIPSGSFRFEKVKGKSHAEANILGIAYKPDGAVGARFSDTVKLDFASQKDLEAFHGQPLHYEKQFLAAPGKYTLKVVFSSGGESFAKLEMPLDIDPYDGKQFMLSGLALSKEFHPAAELGTAQDAELLEGRTPLIFNDLRIVPSGSSRFRKTDAAAIYAEVYEPLLAEAQPPAVEVRMRVVDRKTGEVKWTGVSRPDTAGHAGSPVLPIGLKLNLDALASGTYRVDVEAVDSAGKTMMRSAEFTVE